MYVREKASSAAHHWDYLDGRLDRALCGHTYIDPITLGEIERPKAVCRACQARLAVYHASWWHAQAKIARDERDELRRRFRKLTERSDNQRAQLALLQQKMREKKQALVERQTPSSNVSPKKRNPRPVETSGPKSKRFAPPPPASDFASRLGIPVVAKGREQERTPSPAPDPEKVRKRVKELLGPTETPRKTAAERAADQLARDNMRSQKASTWRLGRSPGSYG